MLILGFILHHKQRRVGVFISESAPAVVSFMSLRQLRPAMVLASSSALR